MTFDEIANQPDGHVIQVPSGIMGNIVIRKRVVGKDFEEHPLMAKRNAIWPKSGNEIPKFSDAEPSIGAD